MMKQMKLWKDFLIHILIDMKMESMKVSDFVFDYVHLLYYKRHNINLDRGRLYIDSPDWLKNKKAKKILSTKNIINTFNMLQQPR